MLSYIFIIDGPCLFEKYRSPLAAMPESQTPFFTEGLKGYYGLDYVYNVVYKGYMAKILRQMQKYLLSFSMFSPVAECKKYSPLGTLTIF